jgi:5-methylcytosine-specific restriction endonuclease McrA
MMASPDHIIPISLGGKHSYENLQCSHLKCNLAKGNRVEELASP